VKEPKGWIVDTPSGGKGENTWGSGGWGEGSRSGEPDRPRGFKGATPSAETTNPKISIFSQKNWDEAEKASSVKGGLPSSKTWAVTPGKKNDVTSVPAQEAMHEGSEGYRDTDRIAKSKKLSAKRENREQSNSQHLLVDVWLWFVSQWWGVTLWGGGVSLRFLAALASYLFAVLGALSAPMAAGMAAIWKVEGRWVTYVHSAIELSLLILVMMAPLLMCPVLVRVVSLFV